VGISATDINAIDITNQRETTALGAAYLAGRVTGFWTSREELAKKWQLSERCAPAMDDRKRNALQARWLKAVERANDWARGDG
jgi:glycerol kinase